MNRAEYRAQQEAKQATLDAQVVPVIERAFARGATLRKTAEILDWVADPPRGYGPWNNQAVKRIADRHGIVKTPTGKCDGRCESCHRPCTHRF